MNKNILSLSISTILLSMSASSYATDNVVPFFEKFHNNPTKIMDELPEKHSNTQNTPTLYFSKEQITGNEFVSLKDKSRAEFIKKNRQPINFGELSRIDYNTDNPANLVDLGFNIETNLIKLDHKASRESHLPRTAWSDTYWPLYSGASAWRYADSPSANNWQEYYDFSHIVKPTEQYINDDRKDLSPAEKYDLLVGDANMSLTKSAWNSGKEYFDSYGEVEGWMGLCHGWAAAAYMMDRPKNAINVKDAKGENLTFYPSDIKALSTLLWASAPYQSHFMGQRCNIKDPEKDENGRIIEQSCFDNNPGSFHTAVLNQIGISQRSLVMDATYDYQVWNQPILSYKLKYVNLISNKAKDNLQDAIINIDDYEEDKFKSYRANNATHIVGVKMELEYLSETSPTHNKTDNEHYDHTVTVDYFYDLELDKKGKIIGGEWYSNAHPDFLWTPTTTAIAQSYPKVYGEWKEGHSIPTYWQKRAISASNKNQPLTKVVYELVKRASK
ncbi:peptidase [uncultured Shewanella sp.]|uniref:peptidase n=1 Tax=uncultured Shewanella sp. TaxID=173975 RepID=UPI00260A1DFA|nr:peptidase [uncultured Shewanella sp.]